jgi:hypothetical protein
MIFPSEKAFSDQLSAFSCQLSAKALGLMPCPLNKLCYEKFKVQGSRFKVQS